MAGSSSNDEYSKRVAAHIASQLPEDSASALRVLALAREIVLHLGKSWDSAPTGGAVEPTPFSTRASREGH